MNLPPTGTLTGPVRHDEAEHPADAGLRSVPNLLAAYAGPVTDAIAAVRGLELARTSPFATTPDERDGQHRAPERPVTVVLVDEPATAPIRLDGDTVGWPRQLLALLAPRPAAVASVIL